MQNCRNLYLIWISSQIKIVKQIAKDFLKDDASSKYYTGILAYRVYEFVVLNMQGLKVEVESSSLNSSFD